MGERMLGERLAQNIQKRGQVPFGVDVVHAVHEQDIVEREAALLLLAFDECAEIFGQLLRVELAQLEGVAHDKIKGAGRVIAVHLVDEDARAVRALPDDHVLPLFDAAEECRARQAELPEYLRHLAVVPEQVADVAAGRGLHAVLAADLSARLQVLDETFARNQPFLGHGVPRADFDAPRPAERGEPLRIFGADAQIVLQHDRLPVHMETLVIGLRFQDVQKRIHHPHEAETILLKRLIPFAVPVGAGYDIKIHTNSPSGEIFLLTDTITRPRKLVNRVFKIFKELVMIVFIF